LVTDQREILRNADEVFSRHRCYLQSTEVRVSVVLVTRDGVNVTPRYPRDNYVMLTLPRAGHQCVRRRLADPVTLRRWSVDRHLELVW
jgi:hypothetical protein